jgi:hypothetical protein
VQDAFVTFAMPRVEGFVLPTACNELCIDLCCDLGVEGRERKRVRRGHMSIFTLALTLALKPAFRFAGMPPISIYSSRVPRRRRPKPSINRGHRSPRRLLGNRRATTEESGYPDAAFISAAATQGPFEKPVARGPPRLAAFPGAQDAGRSLTTQRNPRWLVDVSTASACLAAGR